MSLQPARILIVDDEPNLRRTLSAILARDGYAVCEAENAAAALAALRRQPCQLVFLDLSMPDRHGADLLGELRQLYADLPVLILTAHATLDSAIQAVRQGARDYLVKPAAPDFLLQRVRDILGEYQQPRRTREIVAQIRGLLSELQSEGGAVPIHSLAALPATGEGRVLEKGGFVLDLHARYAAFHGRYLAVSGVNFDYLAVLLRHAPLPVSYLDLVQEAQGYEVIPAEAKTLARWRTHELRKLLEADARRPVILLTVRGVGYRLAV
jgi:DNA-binding response OmpR family regulator